MIPSHLAVNLNLGLRASWSVYYDLTTADTDAQPWAGFWSFHLALGPIAIGLVFFRELDR